MKTIIYFLLSILELPFIILGFLDYFINLICKPLSAGCFLFVIPAILLVPISLIHNTGGSSIIYLKNNIMGNTISYSQALTIYQSRFPEL